jgi:hypothetical protein
MTSTADLDQLLTTIVNELVSAIDADRGRFYLVNEETSELVSRVFVAGADDPHELRLDIGEALRQGGCHQENS